MWDEEERKWPEASKKSDKAGTRESGSAALGNDVVAM